MAADYMVDRICDNCMSRVSSDAGNCPQCGIHFENTNPGGALPNGWVLAGRYTIGRYIDIDGEGVLYSAIDSNTLQRVTVKEFMPVTLCATRDEDGAIVAKPGCEVLYKTTRMDYTDMYKTLMRMGLTEGLVQVLDMVEGNNTAYAIIEKIEGPTLAEYLTKNPAPTEENRAMAILRPVMLGLEALHLANLVHRGVSPDNIILESGGTAKLCGYATLALRQQGSEMKAKLYAGYSAPEQYAASEFEGHYTDVYSLSAVFYRMLTGLNPVSADERKMQDTLIAPRSTNKNIQSYLSTALVRGMRIAPAERIQNISELRLALSGEVRKNDRGFLGLTQKQLIIAACAVSVILIIIIALVISFLFGKKTEEVPSSISEISSSVSSSQEVRVPDFTGKLYADVVQDKQYKGVFTFDGIYEEMFDEKIATGYIISQKTEKETVWDGKPIQFIVSKGIESVIMPDFKTNVTNKDEAIAKLKEVGIEKYTVAGRPNDGTKTPGQVLDTDPAAGTKVPLNGEKEVILYVANEIASVAMPNLQGMSLDAAAAKLSELGIKYNDIKWKTNNGNYAPNTVIEQDVPPDTTITNTSERVTITIAHNVTAPMLTGLTVAEAQAKIESLKTSISGIHISLEPVSEENSSIIEGKIIRTDKDGATVKSGDVIKIFVAVSPPVVPPIDPPVVPPVVPPVDPPVDPVDPSVDPPVELPVPVS